MAEMGSLYPQVVSYVLVLRRKNDTCKKVCVVSSVENFSRVDKQRNEPGRWKSRIVAIFLLFLTLLHVLT